MRQQIPLKARSWLLIPQPSNFSQHYPSELPETVVIWERSGGRSQQILRRTQENLQLSGWLMHAGAGINCSAAAATCRGGDAEDSHAWDYSTIPVSELQLSSSNADEGQISAASSAEINTRSRNPEGSHGIDGTPPGIGAYTRICTHLYTHSLTHPLTHTQLCASSATKQMFFMAVPCK